MTNNQYQLDISAGTIFKILAILVGFWVLFLIRDILLIVLTAIIIASAIEPITLWFGRNGVSRTFAVIIIYLGLGILLFGFIYFFIPSLVQDVQQIINNYPTYLERFSVERQDQTTFLGSIPSTIPLSEVLGGLRDSAQQIAGNAFNFIGAVFGGILSFLLIAVLSFYLAVQQDGVTNFLRIITPFRYEGYITDLWKRTQRKIGRWLQGQIILSLIVGVLSFIGLLILDVPNALTLAILAGMFELIPLFGPILASIPAIAISFIEGGTQLALLVGLLYLLIQQFENHIFHPLIVKKIVGLPAIVVIISLLVGGQLAGFLGILIAVPLAAGLMELLSDIERYKHSADHSSLSGFGIAQSAREEGVSGSSSSLGDSQPVSKDNPADNLI